MRFRSMRIFLSIEVTFFKTPSRIQIDVEIQKKKTIDFIKQSNDHFSSTKKM